MRRTLLCAAATAATTLVLGACGAGSAPASNPGAVPSSGDPMMSGSDIQATLDRLRSEDLQTPRFFIIPGNVPVFGKRTVDWTAEWWRWVMSIPASQNPELVDSADCATDQTGPVFYIPGEQHDVYTRSCTVHFGEPVLLPIWSTFNDYPCPDPTFQPAPGQTLEDFLRQGAVANDSRVTNLTQTVDGVSIDVDRHRFTTGLITFTGDPSLTATFDSCITGTPQFAVSDGWWLLMLLAPGDHTFETKATSPGGHATDQTFHVHVQL